ncbi:hypothetical protein [Methylobacterium radiodurans]|uniref:hypothetical protein n=1 Tax=Methylobacterium radiodurans TaxID=2202828 RepID=UPI0013A55AE0|nr:hypothetical protein [Methylobacterium radiodurans]
MARLDVVGVGSQLGPVDSGIRPFTAVAWPSRVTALSWIDKQETQHVVPRAGIAPKAAGEGGSDPVAS